jgi:hypothetical protein
VLYHANWPTQQACHAAVGDWTHRRPRDPAILGAAFWGGRLLGGVASRRAHVLTVLALSQAAGLVGAAAWALTSAGARPGLEDVWPAAGAGACGAIGLAALYRGMAIGAMGIVAPISAASPVVPLAVDVARGVVPSLLQWVGIVVVLGGIVVLAREPGGAAATSHRVRRRARDRRRPRLRALRGRADASSDTGVAWAISSFASTSTALALTAALVVSVRCVLRRGSAVILAVGAPTRWPMSSSRLRPLAARPGSSPCSARLTS